RAQGIEHGKTKSTQPRGRFQLAGGGSAGELSVSARSAKRADANPHGLPAEDLQHEAEGHEERGHGDPEVEAPPARLPLEPREPEDLQDSHSRPPNPTSSRRGANSIYQWNRRVDSEVVARGG